MNGTTLKRSYYSNSITGFISDDELRILGELSLNHGHALEEHQKNAWIKQIKILRKALAKFGDGQIYFEFSIPRMGKRVDNVLIINDIIFVVEFKVGEHDYDKHAIDQVVDYCLDLKNFHEGSHDELLVPLLVATKAKAYSNLIVVEDNLCDPLRTNEEQLEAILIDVLLLSNDRKVDINIWENSRYKPTPTIIEASQALYRGHNVKEISRHDAGAINLTKTNDCINRVINSSKANNSKSICFITGVPGAGKTLAGLNIANERRKADVEEHAVILSGNGPLVVVLREALIRDDVQAAKEKGVRLTKSAAAKKAYAFIQNIHHFRDDNLKTQNPPIERVVVFDEAQRAWTKEQLGSFMKKKYGIDDFNMSEPEYLVGVMERHKGWCVIICLIGGGQEINTGEAGIPEWLAWLKKSLGEWEIHFSSRLLVDDIYLQDHNTRDWIHKNGKSEEDLHLSVSVRSFRSELISELVHEILDNNPNRSKELLELVGDKFPILFTRNLKFAKSWLKSKAKGSERYGLIASSGGKRLRPYAIDVNNEIDAATWFLNRSEDVRSSNYLENIATEFDIQGLEIDWACVAWDANLYRLGDGWGYQYFEGTAWKNMGTEIYQTYLRNCYRVLLTRARQGLIIFVPEGEVNDCITSKLYYDGIIEYLKSCGINEV